MVKLSLRLEEDRSKGVRGGRTGKPVAAGLDGVVRLKACRGG